MIRNRQIRFSQSEMEQMVRLPISEHCLKSDVYYDKLHNEWVFNFLVVSKAEVITTLFPPLAKYKIARKD